MAGDHHIRQQQLIIELPTADHRRVGHWHALLEQLQERVIAPELSRQLDRYAPPGTTVHLDRLSVEVVVDRPDHLEEDFATAFAAALARELVATPPPATASSPADPGTELLHFLATGNLSWAFPSPTDFAAAVRDWLTGATPADWRPLLRMLEHRSVQFLGRGAQVPGNFLEAAWRVLHPQPTGSGGALYSQTEPPSDPTEWQTRWRAVRDGQIPGTALPTTPQCPEKPTLGGEAEDHHPENAGLILLHPYLGYLLRNTDALDQPGGRPNRPRAAALLHYLVTGRTDCREWDLPLTKVLLGLSPTDQLTPAASLSENELGAADELLDGVIGHWTALGGTSREGLREGFLQRPGVLTRVAGGWQLHVERRGHDLLLDRLPWGYHLIKTPWMEGRLNVDW